MFPPHAKRGEEISPDAVTAGSILEPITGLTPSKTGHRRKQVWLILPVQRRFLRVYSLPCALTTDEHIRESRQLDIRRCAPGGAHDSVSDRDLAVHANPQFFKNPLF